MSRVKVRVKRTAAIVEPTIVEAHNEFLKEKEREGRSAATLENYKVTLKKFMKVLELEEELKLKEVTKDYIEDFIDILKEEEEMAPTSINHYLRDLRTFFNWASNEDEERTYLKKFKVPQLKVQDEGIKFFSDKEIELLAEKPEQKADFVEWRTWAIVKFILGTGARIGTVVNVKMEDLNFTAKQITYTHTKNKKAQTVPLTYQTEKDLKSYIREWRGIAEEDEWLFPSVTDEELTPNAAKLAFADYCHRRGVERTSLHSLRHSFARNYIIQGGNPAKLQAMLGHSSPAMTSHYVKLFGTDLAEGAEDFTLNDNLNKNKARRQKVQRTNN